jgi:gamma-tubulin complex component 3
LTCLQGVYTGKELPPSTQDAGELISRLREYGTSFKDKVHTLVQHLTVHPDLDCRFLAIRLSFSDYYNRKK